MATAAGVWQWLTDNEIEIVAFDETQVRMAAVAFDRYGNGIDPEARLNLADCAANALAKSMNAPLLFKGDDFAATDVLPSASRNTVHVRNLVRPIDLAGTSPDRRITFRSSFTVAIALVQHRASDFRRRRLAAQRARMLDVDVKSFRVGIPILHRRR